MEKLKNCNILLFYLIFITGLCLLMPGIFLISSLYNYLAGAEFLVAIFINLCIIAILLSMYILYSPLLAASIVGICYTFRRNSWDLITFKGRIDQGRFILTVLGLYGALVFMYIPFYIMYYGFGFDIFEDGFESANLVIRVTSCLYLILVLLFILAFVLIRLSAFVKRLRDMDDGVWVLAFLSFVPIINTILFFACLIVPPAKKTEITNSSNPELKK